MARTDSTGVAPEPHQRGRWRSDEDAYLRANYQHMPLVAMAGVLQVDVANLRAHVRKLGLDVNERFYGRPWTRYEDQELSGRWSTESAPMVARLLGRSLSAVRVRASHLKLGRGGPGLTATRVAEIFGVDSHLVVYWIDHGWLKATQTKRKVGKGYRWAIGLEAVEDFITAHPYHFDWRAMSLETAWRHIARRETERQRWLTARQAAKRLGVHVGTLHQHLHKGWVPGVKTTGPSCQGDWRIREDDLHLFQPRKPLGGKPGRGRPGMRRKAA